MTPVAAVKSRDSERRPAATPAMTPGVQPMGPVVVPVNGRNSIRMNIAKCM